MTKEKINKVIKVLEDLEYDKDFRKLIDGNFKITNEGKTALETFDNNFVSVVETLKRIRNTIENRERAEDIRQRKIAIQRVDAQVKGVKIW